MLTPTETRLLEEIHADLKVVRGLLEKQQASQDCERARTTAYTDQVEAYAKRVNEFVSQFSAHGAEAPETNNAMSGVEYAASMQLRVSSE